MMIRLTFILALLFFCGCTSIQPNGIVETTAFGIIKHQNNFVIGYEKIKMEAVKCDKKE